MALGGLGLVSPILYLKVTRIMMFQLSGVHLKVIRFAVKAACLDRTISMILQTRRMRT